MAVSYFFNHGAVVINLCPGTTNEKPLALFKNAGFKESAHCIIINCK
jgi:hypothetical protein